MLWHKYKTDPEEKKMPEFSALDAYVLLELYDAMVATVKQRHLKVDIEPMISMKWLKPSKNEKRRARQRGIGVSRKKLVCILHVALLRNVNS